MKQMILLTAGFVLLVAIFSCGGGASGNLLVGTWKPLDPAEAAASKMKLKFLENKTGVIEIEGRPARAEDTVTYMLKNNGKTLATTGRSGKTEEVQLLELTQKKLVIVTAGRADTMKLIRVE